MQRTLDLNQVGPGLSDVAQDSQAVFRACLSALSRPGRIVEIDVAMERFAGLCAAAHAIALALFDQDVAVWLSPDLADGPVPAQLRFHTGCALVEDARDADFAILGQAADPPRLDAFAAGHEANPEHATTLVLQVDRIISGDGWRLTGPGIRGETRLQADGLPKDFATQWARNASRFPCGLDVFLVCGNRLVGLPRSVTLEA